MNSRWGQYFFIILGLIFIGNTIAAIGGLWRAGDQVDRREKEVFFQRQTNEKLRQKLWEVQSLEYLEKVARDKLNLARPGESVVILPDLPAASPSSQIIDSRPNWVKWRDLIF